MRDGYRNEMCILFVLQFVLLVTTVETAGSDVVHTAALLSAERHVFVTARVSLDVNLTGGLMTNVLQVSHTMCCDKCKKTKYIKDGYRRHLKLRKFTVLLDL